MIKPISSHQTRFGADTITKDPKTGDYKDPLMKWPLRGMAFTNEIGEALRPLIGNYATLTWAPALLYIGADVYDKYKNDQTEYSPNSRRCLEQAIFQGLASILLPIVAVKGGQGLFSLFGLAGKEKITYTKQEQIVELAKQFVANGKMHAYDSKDIECASEFVGIVKSNLDYKSAKKPLKENIAKFFNINHKSNIDNYAKKVITDLIEVRKLLLNPTKTFKNSNLYADYLFALESGQTSNVAIKSVLTNSLKNNTMKGKFIKTSGGFFALAFAIKPIDNFVENVLIGKVISPSLDKRKKSAN